jgi:hypothetical protein
MKSIMLHVRSKDCKSLSEGFNTDLQVNLSAPIIRSSNESMSLSLASAEIPCTWYSISAHLGNNQLYVLNEAPLILADGSYDIYELCDAISSGSFFGARFSINDSRVTLTNNGTRAHTLTFLESYGLARMLGFAGGDLEVQTGASTKGLACVNLKSVHSVYVHSDLTISNVLTSLHGSYESIIDKIPVTCRPFETLQHNLSATPMFSTSLSSSVIQSFRLSLRDQNGKLIQLNGCNFELSLLISIRPATSSQEAPREALRETRRAPQPFTQTPTQTLFPPVLSPVVSPVVSPVAIPTIRVLPPPVPQVSQVSPLPQVATEAPGAPLEGFSGVLGDAILMAKVLSLQN